MASVSNDNLSSDLTSYPDGQWLTVEVWSDVICPWCWIGKRRFERALELFPHKASVRVQHRAFRLRPGVAPLPIEASMAQRFGPDADISQMIGKVQDLAAEEGLLYRLAGTQVGDTIDAHRLLLYAASQGVQGKAVERFYRGFFSEQASLFDRESILDLAVDAGLDRDAARTVLESTAYVDDVEADQKNAREYGSTSVPFYLFDGKVAVSGGQAPDQFLAALEQAWDGRAEAAATSEPASGACGPDACGVPDVQSVASA